MAKELALPSQTVNQFVPSLRVVLSASNEVDIPLTAQDNLLLSQVRAAYMRKKFDERFDELMDQLTPDNFKKVVETFAKIEDIARFAYAPALNEIEGGERAGQAAAQLAKSFAEGAVTAGIKAGLQTKNQRLKQILELGRSKKDVIIDVADEEVA